jgi:plastocyanin
MAGTANGSAVWFDPIGIRVSPGATINWINVDPGNSHTATAYHPVNGRQLRLPDGAEPWDSGYLLPGQDFSVTLAVPGVFDFFCRPHEHAGMVGRIVVAAEGEALVTEYDALPRELPDLALAAFPDVADILRLGVVRPTSR